MSRFAPKPPQADPISNHVVQGEQRVTSDPETMLTTILGSCVAACMRDPVAGIGGMNHFLLPGTLDDDDGTAGRLGVHAMELLINALLARGASRRRLEAKVFGGASLKSGLTDVGTLNARFAKQFIERENIQIVSECLGGRLGRRVQYWPVSGRARRVFLQSSEVPVAVAPKPLPAPAPDAGLLELF